MLTLEEKKAELLRLAKAGAPRPKHSLDHLGTALTNLSKREPLFVETLYKYAPGWRAKRSPWVFDDVVVFYLDNGRLPHRSSPEADERRLAEGLDKRLAKGHSLYSPAVEAWAKDKLEGRRMFGYARASQKRSTAVQCLNTLQIFPSASEAARFHAIHQASVSQTFKPGRSTRSGLRFVPVGVMA